MEAEHLMLQSDKGGEHWLTSCSSLQFAAARPTQFQNRTHSRCSLNLDDPHCWLVQVIRIFTPTVGLLSVQIKEGVEESEWVPMLRIRAGGWCQIKKGAVRPRADAGTWPWSQLCVECEMSEEELQRRARNRIIKIELTKTEQSRNITVNAALPIVGLKNDKHFDQQRNICSDK